MKDENIPDATEPERVLIQGRLQDSTDRFVQEFTASVDFDKRLSKAVCFMGGGCLGGLLEGYRGQ